jgi:hypothetical protein
MSEKQLILNITELNLISFQCSKCNAEVVIQIPDSRNRFLNACPACHESYPKWPECAVMYQEFYNLASGNGVRIRTSWPGQRETD